MQDPRRPPDVALFDYQRYSILAAIDEFFDDRECFDLMFQIVARDPKDTTTQAPSLRQLYKRIRQQLPPEHFDLYENAIATNSKQLFDTFCRQNNPEGVVAFEKHGKRILTSIAQLNLFRIIISHGVLGSGCAAACGSTQPSNTPAPAPANAPGNASGSKQRLTIVHTKTTVWI